jgi:hypothetical protein
MTKYYFRPRIQNFFAMCVIVFVVLVTVLLTGQVKELVDFNSFRLWKMFQQTQLNDTRQSNQNVPNANVVHYNLLEEKIGLKKKDISECSLGKYAR